MSRKQYKHLLETNFANIKTITAKFRNNDNKNKRNNSNAKQKKRT